MIAPEVLTYRDLIDYMVDVMDGLEATAEQRRVRRAIRDAMYDLGLSRTWRYFRRFRRVNLVAPFTGESGATFAYDHTGGASERLVTFTPGAAETLPEWTRDAALIFDTVLYPVSEVATDFLSLTLPVDFNPGEDVAAAGATLVRTLYPIDGDVTAIHGFLDEQGSWESNYIPAGDWLGEVRRGYLTQDCGFRWTVMGDENRIGQMALAVYGHPVADQTFDFMASVLPRRLKYSGYGATERSGGGSGSTARQSDSAFSSTPVPARCRSR